MQTLMLRFADSIAQYVQTLTPSRKGRGLGISRLPLSRFAGSLHVRIPAQFDPYRNVS